MSYWSDLGFFQALIISILGLSIGSWWLYSRIVSKVREVGERKERQYLSQIVRDED